MKKIYKNIAIAKKRWRKLNKLQKMVVVVCIFTALIVIYYSQKDSKNTSEYQFTSVKKGSVEQVISESGEVLSTGVVEVPSTITGIVDEVYVENGQVVSRGTNLFSVTSSATEAERTAAYSTYQTSVSTLDTANSNYRSRQASVENVLDTLSGHDEDETLEQKDTRTTAEALRDNAYYSVVSAKSAVAKTWLAYQATADGTVKATAHGTVSNISIARGQYTDSDETALLIESDGDLWVNISVTENDIVFLEPGQTASISVDALSDLELFGLVERVDSVGTVVSGVVTYEVYISITSNLEARVLPSMTVNIDVVTQKKDGVLLVPNAAIKPYQGKKAVQIVDVKTGQLIYLPVEIGIVGTTKTEVVSGLTEGQRIISTSSGNDSQSDRGGNKMMPFGGKK